MAHKGGVLLLFGSQTGQSETIVEEIAEKGKKAGLTFRKCCLDKTETEVFPGGTFQSLIKRNNLSQIAKTSCHNPFNSENFEQFWIFATKSKISKIS